MKIHAKPAKLTRLRVAILAFFVLTLVLLRPAGAHLRAASLLVRFADPNQSGLLAGFGAYPIEVTDTLFDGPSGPLRARIYAPEGTVPPSAAASTGTMCSGCAAEANRVIADAPPGLVLLHGVHRLGIDEPRLIRFSRVVAAAGFAVLTPEVREIADYRVDPISIDTIGTAAKALRQRLGGARVGILGMSFAGGLSLLTAADPRYADDIGLVVAIGAHHDLHRVARFFATNQVEMPDGHTEHLKAHEYGALVLVYGNAESFFPASDVTAARDALRLWLWEQHDLARERAKALSPEARARVGALFDGKIDAVAGDFSAEIERLRDSMARVSPSRKLGSIKAPVFLLHGAGDTVIPAGETLWLAKEVPEDLLRGALISPAVVHVELDGDPPILEKWALVRFMKDVLSEAEASR